jgi:type II secretory pathway predicted ATPase ExeA
MFLDFYNLREQPFGVTPDLRYFYLSRTHREALASLYYGAEMGRGFLALIGPPGMGKTTVLFRLLERLRKSVYTAFLFQTQCNSEEFLRSLAADMGINSHGQDLVQVREELNEALVRLKLADRRFVLVIDEAQNLEDSVLETVRLLSDFETPSSKLMQIIIAGQPQLAAKLARPSLLQLRQRVAILCRLEPFSLEETNCYIDDRLQVAGRDGPPLFSPEARAIIAARSHGIPRNINNLCFNALSMGYALRRKEIDAEIVREVVKDFDVESLVGEGDEAPPVVSAGSPLESPRATASKRHGGFRLRPLRAAALAASLVLAGLLLFFTVRRLLGTELERVFPPRVMPPAKSLDFPRPTLSPTLSTTTPAYRNAAAEPAGRGTVPSVGPPVGIEVKPWQTRERTSGSDFGRFDKKLVQGIPALNPQITNINDLAGGGESPSLGGPRHRPGPNLRLEEMSNR